VYSHQLFALPLPADGRGPINFLTVDVEDYFHVNAFAEVVSRDQWPSMESRVVRNTDRLLDLFAEHGVTGTFFILGWVAERHRDLVARIASAGHELGSHSYWHRLVYTLSPDEFRDDLRRARDRIESAGGVRVRGFRAPSYSVIERSLWALDILLAEGYDYDSSIFPIAHDVYGIPGAPDEPHVITREAGGLLEIPGTAADLGALQVPIGGGYFRLMPYAATRSAIERINRRHAAMFYIHPWEIDPEQPRIAAPLKSRLRHYNSLGRTEARLRRLLGDFRWGPIGSVVPDRSGIPA
jgi:polysaccharide deacetylase family protein (PEP-CTERM system associated)